MTLFELNELTNERREETMKDKIRKVGRKVVVTGGVGLAGVVGVVVSTPLAVGLMAIKTTEIIGGAVATVGNNMVQVWKES